MKDQGKANGSQQSIREIGIAERIEILAWLREARARVLEDAESFVSAAAVVERVGQVIAREIKYGLGEYDAVLSDLSNQSRLHIPDKFDRLFRLVKDARNDAVHEGAFARHMAAHLVDLVLILEDAITSTMKTVGDLMVPNPLTAESWHLVGHVRNAMLKNSFSYMPYYLDDGVEKGWFLISDESVVGYLKRWRSSKGAYNKARSVTVETAIRDQDLVAVPAPTLMASDLVPDHQQQVPWLVFDDRGHLLGILTNFDLL